MIAGARRGGARPGRVTLGATGWSLPPSRCSPTPPPAEHELALAVVGAHMSGLPLNDELTRRGGRLLRATTTAPRLPPLRAGRRPAGTARTRSHAATRVLPSRSRSGPSRSPGSARSCRRSRNRSASARSSSPTAASQRLPRRGRRCHRRPRHHPSRRLARLSRHAAERPLSERRRSGWSRRACRPPGSAAR